MFRLREQLPELREPVHDEHVGVEQGAAPGGTGPTALPVVQVQPDARVRVQVERLDPRKPRAHRGHATSHHAAVRKQHSRYIAVLPRGRGDAGMGKGVRHE